MLRTHTCDELRKTHAQQHVTLAGWVHAIRTHGTVTFIDLRDRYGITQLVFTTPIRVQKETVIQITGRVEEKTVPNKALSTGEVEVHVETHKILSKANPLPFDENATEETRMKYRYLDLRATEKQHKLIERARIIRILRAYLDEQGFIELETPQLGKSTPEGSRDYLVPSRTQPGTFYALPQSPQLFKQLFMIAGMDKYYQVARCFRDEDLRKDRQPEFTQLDIEMSFVEQEDVMELIENLTKHLWKEYYGKELLPFRRLTYEEAMRTYGSDKPDTRFALHLTDVTTIAHKTPFAVFTNAEYVTALKVPRQLSRKEIEALTDCAKIHHAQGLAWTHTTAEGLEGGIGKFLTEHAQEIKTAMDATQDETILFVADEKRTAQNALGAVRSALGEQLGLMSDTHAFLWVTDFPMFEYSEEEQRYVAAHHPFTMPVVGSAQELVGADKKTLTSYAYDLVLNGSEIAGGSIRIHDTQIQQEVFTLLGIRKEEAQERFGFFLEALTYGTPPHGGLAWGLDRLITIMLGGSSIRDVIAFPKNKEAQDVMLAAPSGVREEQLTELNLSFRQEQ